MTTVTAVNVSTVTAALVSLLDEALGNVAVVRAEEINETPGNCPWVGVYRDNVEYVIKTLGFGSGMREQRINLVVVVQESDGTSGERCEDRLEELLKNVVGAILSDVTLRSTVQVVTDFQVRYADYRKIGGGFMQTAAVYLTAVTTVLVS